MTRSNREKLAEAQAALMRSLLCGDQAPSGFDEPRIQAAARSLQRKRRRALLDAWPLFEREFAPNELSPWLDEFTTQTALSERGGPLADGRKFIEWLSHKRGLPYEVQRNAFRFDLRYQQDSDGFFPRTSTVLQLRRLLPSFRWMIGCYLASRQKVYLVEFGKQTPRV